MHDPHTTQDKLGYTGKWGLILFFFWLLCRYTALLGLGLGPGQLSCSCPAVLLAWDSSSSSWIVWFVSKGKRRSGWTGWLAVWLSKHAVFLVCTLAVAFGDLVRRNICRKASINIGYNGTPSTGFKALLSYILSLRTAANLKSGPPITTRLVYDTQHIASIFLRSLSKPLSML